jgi:hypothetical protein
MSCLIIDANNNQVNEEKRKHHQESKKVAHIEEKQINNNQENIKSNVQVIHQSAQKSPENKLKRYPISEDFIMLSPPSFSELEENEEVTDQSTEDEEAEFLTISYEYNIASQ